MTVSDHLLTGEALPADQREKTFGDMVEIALQAAFPSSSWHSSSQTFKRRRPTLWASPCRF